MPKAVASSENNCKIYLLSGKAFTKLIKWKLMKDALLAGVPNNRRPAFLERKAAASGEVIQSKVTRHALKVATLLECPSTSH